MPTYHARATVLKKTKLGEADLIITLIATDGRELRAVAKGARKPASKIGARIEPFTVLEGQFATGRSLDVVSDVRTVATHASLRDDYDKLLVASVAAEMLEVVASQAQATDFLYEMSAALFDMMDASASIKALQLLIAWMLKLFAVLGYRPILDGCAVCGRTLADDEQTFCWSAEAGGVICSDCGAGQFIPLDAHPAAALAWLRTLFGATFEEAAAFDLEPQLTGDLFSLVADFATEHFPARIKSLEFLRRSGILAAGGIE
ncbi:MAG: DNA repair protein RecO [Actinomycetia bacterium]|nr:DNA repair protein RecO [Actinomycetes bacterium]